MTKKVRIENADTGDYFKVDVEVWEKFVDGSPDRKVRTLPLGFPTAQLEEYIHDMQYLVIRERHD